jgi:hypothetical protein
MSKSFMQLTPNMLEPKLKFLDWAAQASHGYIN